VSDQPGYAADEAGVTAHLFLDGDRADLAEHVTVDGADGHHLQRARRVGPGEHLTAADGHGRWRRYEVVDAARGVLELRAAGAVHDEPAPEWELVAAPALISRTRFDAVVAQLTELGVDAVVPFVAERCVARWDRGDHAAITARLGAVAREAAMQSRRARIPRVDPPATPSQIASRDARIVVAARDGARDIAPVRGDHVVVVSGPEGGLSARDVADLGAHECLCLGRFVLRAETAPVAAASVFTLRRETCDGS
jgi:16S rRNA (uracil1498-N3)-methyltransferase